MFKQTRDRDLALFVKLAKIDRPKTRADVPTYVLIPAFIISELKTAFQIGFLIFLPFLVIDLVVSSTLMSMGMMMLPPVFISLPFKILLFVLVDGWNLVTQSLVRSFAADDGHRPRHQPRRRGDGARAEGRAAAAARRPRRRPGRRVFQAVTQIQEQTLTFIPKILATVVVMVVGGPWMLDQLLSYTRDLWTSIPNLIG